MLRISEQLSSIDADQYDVLRNKVDRICSSREDYILSREALQSGERTMPTVADFSAYGIGSMAGRLNFPSAAFTSLISHGCDDLANAIIERYTNDYLKSKKTIFVRSFDNKIYGFLSPKYSCFDDNEVLDIVENSGILEQTENIWYSAHPERFHARFIDKDKFTVGNDHSNLSMAVFVDNSMVGGGSFKIRYGIYRHACTNGCIWGLKEFTLAKEQHKGEKEWTQIAASAVADTQAVKELIKRRIQLMQGENSAIYGLDPDKAIVYLKNRLATNEKTAAKILDFYQNTYGGHSKWDLCNAITDVAHDLTVDARLDFEQKALFVA